MKVARTMEEIAEAIEASDTFRHHSEILTKVMALPMVERYDINVVGDTVTYRFTIDQSGLVGTDWLTYVLLVSYRETEIVAAFYSHPKLGPICTSDEIKNTERIRCEPSELDRLVSEIMVIYSLMRNRSEQVDILTGLSVRSYGGER